MIGADLPAFRILSLMGGNDDTHPQRMPTKTFPGFDDQFAIIVDATEPGSRERIDRLLTAGALQAVMRIDPVDLKAKGDFIQLSRRSHSLPNLYTPVTRSSSPLLTLQVTVT